MPTRGTFKQYDIPVSEQSELGFHILPLKDSFSRRGENLRQPHVHTFYHVIWFQKGTGKHYVDFEEYPISENTLFFLSPGQVHYFDENTDYEGVGFEFSDDFLFDEVLSENTFAKYSLFHAFDAVPYYHITGEDALRLKYIVDYINEELAENKEEFAHHSVMVFLVKLFLIIVQRRGVHGKGQTLNISNASHRTFVTFRKMLEQHYKTIHTVRDYADMMRVSVKTLSQSVYDSSRSTPLNIINERILLEAKRQLIHSNLKVKEIAFNLGFDDPSYFVKFFKRQTGRLPTEMRTMEKSL